MKTRCTRLHQTEMNLNSLYKLHLFSTIFAKNISSTTEHSWVFATHLWNKKRVKHKRVLSHPIWRDFCIRSCSFIKCNVIVARWLIQCGRSDVTGKIKMDITSREEDGDVEGVHREGWDKEVSVYSVWVWPTFFGMGCREDLLFWMVIIFHRISQVREKSTALLCFQRVTVPSPNMYKPFFCICGEGDFGFLHPFLSAPTRSPHCKHGRDSGQKRENSMDKRILCWESSDWRIYKSLLLIKGSSCLW